MVTVANGATAVDFLDLLGQAKCGFRCIAEASREVKCDERNFLTCGCANIGAIREISKPCLNKCNIGEEVQGVAPFTALGVENEPWLNLDAAFITVEINRFCKA